MLLNVNNGFLMKTTSMAWRSKGMQGIQHAIKKNDFLDLPVVFGCVHTAHMRRIGSPVKTLAGVA